MSQRKTRPMPRRPSAIAYLPALSLLLCLGGQIANAQQAVDHKAPASAEGQHQPGKPEAQRKLADALPADAVTTHTITVGGHELAYTATAGTLALTNDKGER